MYLMTSKYFVLISKKMINFWIFNTRKIFVEKAKNHKNFKKSKIRNIVILFSCPFPIFHINSLLFTLITIIITFKFSNLCRDPCSKNYVQSNWEKWNKSNEKYREILNFLMHLQIFHYDTLTFTLITIVINFMFLLKGIFRSCPLFYFLSHKLQLKISFLIPITFYC